MKTKPHATLRRCRSPAAESYSLADPSSVLDFVAIARPLWHHDLLDLELLRTLTEVKCAGHLETPAVIRNSVATIHHVVNIEHTDVLFRLGLCSVDVTDGAEEMQFGVRGLQREVLRPVQPFNTSFFLEFTMNRLFRRLAGNVIADLTADAVEQTLLPFRLSLTDEYDLRQCGIKHKAHNVLRSLYLFCHDVKYSRLRRRMCSRFLQG